MNRVTDAEAADSTWKSLYRVGGAAALLTEGILHDAKPTLISLSRNRNLV